MSGRKCTLITLLVLTVAVPGLLSQAESPQDSSSWKNRPWWVGKRMFLTDDQFGQTRNRYHAAVEEKARLDSRSAAPWVCEWNPLTGLPKHLWPNASEDLHGGDPREVAERFLQEYRPLFTGIKRDDDRGDITFEFIKVDETSEGDSMVMFRELYRGIPVMSAGPFVIVDEKGAIGRVVRFPFHVQGISVMPSITPDEIVSVFEVAFQPATAIVDTSHEPTLGVFPLSTPPRLVYSISGSVRGREWMDWGTYLVDAHSGEVVSFEASHTGGPLRQTDVTDTNVVREK